MSTAQAHGPQRLTVRGWAIDSIGRIAQPAVVMSDLLSLTFGLSPSPSRYAALETNTIVDASISAPMRSYVLNRDSHSCRYCGLRAGKYQEVVATGKVFHDPDQLHTACVFCHAVLAVDRTVGTGGGALIWAPEIRQADLCAWMRGVYAWRIKSGEPADRARAVLNLLLSRRELVAEATGLTALPDLVERLKQPRALAPDVLKGLRLLPLDRTLIRESDLRFNRFPQILAYWRSRNGPMRSAELMIGVPELEAALATIH